VGSFGCKPTTNAKFGWFTAKKSNESKSLREEWPERGGDMQVGVEEEKSSGEKESGAGEAKRKRRIR